MRLWLTQFNVITIPIVWKSRTIANFVTAQKWPAPPAKYDIHTRYGYVITASVAAFCPLSESAGGPLSSQSFSSIRFPSIRYPIPSQEASNALITRLGSHRLSYEKPVVSSEHNRKISCDISDPQVAG
ncbi:hypothetical protein EVAR_32801_1 [Eumeta japonica]|uniref:Uncharacterized protein n=1 Tax=Eumeta variegata TaxID=151549 RepID=A0A4C1WF70_EUMVA|nr:hypothetical protein EVAR_32801_1 [Eumeta japonica]